MNHTMKRRLASYSFLLTLTCSGLVADEDHKKQIENTLKQGLDVSKTGTQVNLGKKGGPQKSFVVNTTRNGPNIKVTLLHVGGADTGRQASLEYDEARQTILIAAAGKQLAVVINPDNTVTAGGKVCPGTSPGCIANAVIAGMPHLHSEEVATMLTVLNDDLHTKKNGEHISTALLQIAAQLNKPATAAPAMPKSK